ncbi:MAG: DNA-binding domain-containing protein [Pseudomonadota bacterium]
MNTRPEYPYRASFAAALIEPAADASPAGLDPVAARRFRVYRNNVQGALIEALRDAYPVVCRLVGDEFFVAMARQFVLAETSRDSSLTLYGEGFDRFIEVFAPAQSVPYLADVAKLERAWLESLNAADQNPLDAAELAVDGEQLLDARFETHPAARLVLSAHPVVSIWRANLEDEGTKTIEAGSETALVTRPGFDVMVTAFDQAGGQFVGQFLKGQTVQSACQVAASIDHDFDVGAAFGQLLQAGVFARVNFNTGDKP